MIDVCLTFYSQYNVDCPEARRVICIPMKTTLSTWWKRPHWKASISKKGLMLEIVCLFYYETMFNCSQNLWIVWNSAALYLKRLFHTGVWTFGRFVRPLLATIVCVWEIWSGSNRVPRITHGWIKNTVWSSLSRNKLISIVWTPYSKILDPPQIKQYWTIMDTFSRVIHW